jgi:1-acyl-sn-glycerol-3-phosphate acyltransferase
MIILARLLRFAMFLATFSGLCIFILIISPLTVLNPLLRSLRVRERYFPWLAVQALVMQLSLLVGGVRLTVIDRSNVRSRREACIYMYNHSSNMDPLIVASVTSAKFIYKKELNRVPVLGWDLYLYDHVAINRSNREQAIESLCSAVKGVVQKHQSIAIAPEGTRSRTGELLEFKKGPFHLARQSGAPLVPVVIQGAHSLLPPKSVLLRGGHVTVTLLPPIPAPANDEEIERTRIEARKIFSDHLSSNVAFPRPSEFSLTVPAIIGAAVLYRLVVL